MSKESNSIEDYVFSLSNKEFILLKGAVDKRIHKEKYGFTSFEEAALNFGRIPICPKCKSTNYHNNSFAPSNHKRCGCDDCNTSLHFLLIQYLTVLRYRFISF